MKGRGQRAKGRANTALFANHLAEIRRINAQVQNPRAVSLRLGDLDAGGIVHQRAGHILHKLFHGHRSTPRLAGCQGGLTSAAGAGAGAAAAAATACLRAVRIRFATVSVGWAPQLSQ